MEEIAAESSNSKGIDMDLEGLETYSPSLN
ncbi:uncharacterized protein G2W53_011759 [Senna tora]|uniref:Uncharacterized protein n=1 Tax=Senna tora TaxID=362788 RepID=A0A834X1Z8_9FABA|nr:uncharacterized protein G2W53_011759 [Senna tora]